MTDGRFVPIELGVGVEVGELVVREWAVDGERRHVAYVRGVVWPGPGGVVQIGSGHGDPRPASLVDVLRRAAEQTAAGSVVVADLLTAGDTAQVRAAVDAVVRSEQWAVAVVCAVSPPARPHQVSFTTAVVEVLTKRSRRWAATATSASAADVVADLDDLWSAVRGDGGAVLAALPTTPAAGAVFPVGLRARPRRSGAHLDDEVMFAGREVACEEITAWLATEAAAPECLVVRGCAGAGTSTLLRHLHDVLSDASTAVLVDARGRTTSSVLEEAAVLLGAVEPDGSGDAARRALQSPVVGLLRPTLLVDSVGAVDPAGALDLASALRRLVARGFRIVVGGATDDAVLGALGPHRVVDIDGDTHAAIVEYVERRLGGVAPGTPPEVLRRVARTIAFTAGGSFVHASVAVASLVRRLPALDDGTWHDVVSAPSVGAAVDADIRRGDPSGQVRATLAALASTSAGSSAEAWADLDDVDRALGVAGWYVTRTLGPRGATFSIAHEEVRAHLAGDAVQMLPTFGDPSFVLDASAEAVARHAPRALATGGVDERRVARAVLRLHSVGLPERASERLAALRAMVALHEPGSTLPFDRSVVAPAWHVTATTFAPRPFTRELTGHDGWVWSLAITTVDDGAWLGSGGADGVVRVADLGTGATLAVLEGHAGPVSSVSFGVVDDIPVLISGSFDRTVRVWDATSWTMRRSLEGHERGVWGARCSSIGGRSYVVSTGADASIRIWEPDTGAEVGRLLGHTDWVWTTASASVGGTTVIASASDDHTIRIWDPVLEECLAVLHAHESGVSDLAFQELDGDLVLVSCSHDGTVCQWRTSDWTLARQVHCHDDWIRSIAVGEGVDPIVVTASDDGTAGLWTASLDARGRLAGRHQGAVAAVATTATAGGPIVVTGGSDGRIVVWDATSEVDHEATPITAVALGAGERDPIVHVVAAPTGLCSVGLDLAPTGGIDLDVGDERILGIAASDQMAGVAITVSDGTVRWCDAAAAPVALVGHETMPGPVACAGAHPDPLLVSGDVAGVVLRWSLPRREVTARFRAHDWVTALAATVSPKPMIASGGGDGLVRLWDDGGSPVCEVTAHLCPVARLSIGTGVGDRLLVASAGQDGQITVVDVIDGSTLLSRRAHHAPVTFVGIDVIGDETVVGSASEDGTFVVHHVSTRRWSTIRVAEPITTAAMLGSRVVLGTTRGCIAISISPRSPA